MGDTVRILPRLLAGFVALVLLMAILGAVALMGAGRLAQQMELLYQHPFAVNNAIRSAQADIVSLQRWGERLLVVDTLAEREAVLDEMARNEKGLAERIEVIRERYLGPRSDIDRLEGLVAAAQRERRDLLGQGNEGHVSALTKAEFRERLHFSHRPVEDAILAIREFAMAKAEDFRREARRQADIVRGIMVGAVILVVFASLAIGMSVVRHTLSPLDELRRGMIGIARGDIKTEIPYLGDRSEVGELARALEHLRENALELERSNAALASFAHITSHDLREPLRTINIYLDRLDRRLGDSLDEEGREFIVLVMGAAQRLNRMILDLLAYSELDRDVEPPRPVAAAMVAHSAVSALRGMIDSLGGRVSLPPEMPVVAVRGNDLLHLFRHLLVNALKFRVEGRAPEVDILVERDGLDWRFGVRDNGIGLPQDTDQRERIFRIFQRLHQNQDFGGGSGIGLAACRKIVERNGGHIWVESAGEDRGATFYFTLPQAASDPLNAP
ncbi:MAG: ATP-binding protein [Magnetospirillum sp. WYHS-4]